MVELTKKVVIVGDASCGKTSLVNVFCGNGFDSSDYKPTIYSNDNKASIEITIQKQIHKIASWCGLGCHEQKVQVTLELWDTGGQEEVDRLRPICYPDCDVVLICFSVADKNNFHNVTDKWAPEIKHFCRKIPIILVGTKRDIRMDRVIQREFSKSKRKSIQFSEIREISKDIKAFEYIECSAKTNDGVYNVFEAAARAALGMKMNKTRSEIYTTL